MSLYKEVLMNHFRNPEFKYENSNAKYKEDGINPSCGDNITLFFNNNGKISNLSYIGNGCAISMASADIMCELFNNGCSTDIIEKFISMIEGEEVEFSNKLDKLNAFKELQTFPARRNCALLPWKTLKKSIKP